MTSCAYRGMSALPVAGAARGTAESERPAPFSLRAALTEFREPHVRTNRNPKSFCAFCSSTSQTTERPAGQISCETRSQETSTEVGGRERGGAWSGVGREGGLRVRRSSWRKLAFGIVETPGCLGDNG